MRGTSHSMLATLAILSMALVPLEAAWQDRTSTIMPTSSVFSKMVTVGDVIYWFGGNTIDSACTETYSDQFYSFDTSVTPVTATQITAGGPSARVGHCMVTDGTDNIYVFGGTMDSGTVTSELWQFSISGGTWTNVTSLYTAVGGWNVLPTTDHQCYLQGNNLYVFGGLEGFGALALTNEMRLFDVTTTPSSTPAWSQIGSGSVPSARSFGGGQGRVRGGGMVGTGTTVYVVGGSTSGGLANDMYRFDTSAQTWTAMTSPPTGSISSDGGAGALVLLNSNYLVVFNAWRGNAENVCENHDFRTEECLGIGCCQVDMGVCFSNVGAGNCDPFGGIEGIELLQYIVNADQWVDVTHQFDSPQISPRPGGGQALTVVNGGIYVYGGESTTALAAGCNELRSDLWAATCSAAAGFYCDGLRERVCAEGFYCVGGSAAPQPCTSPAGMFCPEGSWNTTGITCLEGYYCLGDSNPHQPCTAPISTYCAPGAEDNTAAWHTICPAGSYCTGGSDKHLPCTCSPGFFCDAGESIATGEICPIGHFCTGQDNDKQACTSAPGYYCDFGFATGEGVMCEAGTYCAGGTSPSRPCTAQAGYYCDAGSSVSEGEACPEGYWCEGESSDKEACTVRQGFYCPAAASAPTPVSCPAGHYCMGGTEPHRECTAAAGYHCRVGSFDPAGELCTVGSYCPGHSEPIRPCDASAGYYCDEGSHLALGEICPALYYCDGGTADKVLCQPTVGKFCPEGTPTAQQIPCTVGHYCPGTEARAFPCDCQAGFYCPEGFDSPEGTLCPGGHYCFGQQFDATPCNSPEGSYCPPGSAVPSDVECPAGRFCQGGANTAVPCSAPEGSFCDVGTASESAYAPCPQGSYCRGGFFNKVACAVEPGYHCPEGTASSRGVPCEEEEACPGGSAQALSCTPNSGFYCPEILDTPAGSPCPPFGEEGQSRCPCSPGFSLELVPLERRRSMPVHDATQSVASSRSVSPAGPQAQNRQNSPKTRQNSLTIGRDSHHRLAATLRQKLAFATKALLSPASPSRSILQYGSCSESEIATHTQCVDAITVSDPAVGTCDADTVDTWNTCLDTRMNAFGNYTSECDYYAALRACYEEDPCLCGMDPEISGYSELSPFIASSGCQLEELCTGEPVPINTGQCNDYLQQYSACELECQCTASSYQVLREETLFEYQQELSCTVAPACGVPPPSSSAPLQNVQVTGTVSLQSFSLAFWMARSSEVLHHGVIFAQKGSDEFYVLNKGGGVIRLEFSASVFAEWDLGTSVLDSYNWAHYTIAYGASSKRVRLYRNGFEIEATAPRIVTKQYNGRGDFYIGSPTVPARRSVQGVMLDDVLVFSSVLNDEQVAQAMVGQFSELTADRQLILRFNGDRTDSKFVVGGEGAILQEHCNYNPRAGSGTIGEDTIVLESDLLDVGCWGFREHEEECPNVVNQTYCLWVTHAVHAEVGAAQCTNQACSDIVAVHDDPEFLLAVNLTDLIFQVLSLIAAIVVIVSTILEHRKAAAHAEAVQAAEVDGQPPAEKKKIVIEDKEAHEPTLGKALPKQLNWVFCILAFVLSCLEMQKILGSSMVEGLDRLTDSYCFFDQDNMDPDLMDRVRSEFRSIRICAPFKLVFVIVEMFSVFNMDTTKIIWVKPTIDVIQTLISAIDLGFTGSIVVHSEDIYDRIKAVQLNTCTGGGDNYWCFCAEKYEPCSEGGVATLQASLLATMLLGVLVVTAGNAMGRRRLF